jgi:hypothetical protein
MLNTKYIKWVLILSLVFLPYCGKDATESTVSDTWLIPDDQIRDGGPGKDGIPALTNPPSIPLQQATYLDDDDLVIGIQMENTIRAYSHPILDQHEIANDGIGNTFFAMTYCPLTGSALAWDTTDFTGDKTFGVSGLLYNSNLIPYDRLSDSNWSQMLLLCVNGSRIGEKAKPIFVVETTWETWKQLYPQSTVLSDNTGHTRNYDIYPYGDYKTSDNLLFSVSNQDSRLHKKERVLGIMVGDKTKVYPISSFDESIEVINETFNGLQLVVAGSADLNFAVSFEGKLPDGTLLDFDPVEGELPVIMTDNEGTKWDIFGNGVSGPRVGSRLTPTLSFISYWFAWVAFYPGAEIHNFSTPFGASDVMSDGEITQNNRSFRRKEFIRSEIGRRALKEWPMIIRETELVPYYFDGKISGLQITIFPEDSILSEIGISRGDVIKSINGIELTDAAQLLGLWEKFRNENRFEVNLERNGKPLLLFYILK